MTSSEGVEILLIDDNADYLLLIRRALEHRDARYKVTGVVGPDEGLELLRSRHFDLVLLDYKFPRGGNGLQLIRALKHEATYIPTVMVTAFGDESLAIQAMREGALDFVPKTSDFIQALPDVVARAIDRGRIIRERISTQRALESSNRELSALLDIATALNAGTDRDAILDVVASRLGDLLGARRAATYLRDASGRLTRVSEGSGPDRLDLAEDARSLVVRSLVACEVLVDADETGQAQLCMPLVAQDRAIGVMEFRVRDREQAEQERALCAGVGRQVGVALEHARLYVALASTERRLSNLVDNAGDEVVAVDPWGRVLSWNGGAEAIYGWSAGDIIGRDWETLWPADRSAEPRELLRRVLEGGETIRNHDTVRVSRDGTRLDILLTLSPISQPSGSVTGVSCIGKNLTTQKQLQQQLVQSEKMATVGHLISGVAHELNNPLTAVLGYAQLIAETDVGDRLPRYVEKIASEAQRSQRIVQNLLAFARKHEPRASRVDMGTVVRETLELASYDLRAVGIELCDGVAQDLPTTLADPHQLQQVFLNIITNARHALRSSPRPRIAVGARLEECGLDGRPAIVVSFADNGPGVPENLRKRIFDPFFTTKGVGEGTGLGLSLAYGIVEEHGGHISVGSSDTGGALFEIRLPVLGAAPAARKAQDAASLAARRRILLVDDEPDVREMVSDVLRLDGHDIETAHDGVQALDKIMGSVPYDLIIVDLKLPDFGGDRLWREVSNIHPELARRMVFSGSAMSPEGRRAVEGSGGRWLPKPFGAEDVRRTISSFFGPARPAVQRETA